MKTPTFLILTFMSLFLFASCGGDNQISTNPTGISSTSPFVNTAKGDWNWGKTLTTTVLNQLNTSMACPSGKPRFRVNYNTGNVGNQTKLVGPFQQGAIPGTSANDYLGVSQSGDIMIVSKMTDGQNIRGYNIAVLFCPAYNQANGQEIIGPSAGLTQFTTDFNGIILDDDTNCKVGSVDSSATYIRSPQYIFDNGFILTVFFPDYNNNCH